MWAIRRDEHERAVGSPRFTPPTEALQRQSLFDLHALSYPFGLMAAGRETQREKELFCSQPPVQHFIFHQRVCVCVHIVYFCIANIQPLPAKTKSPFQLRQNGKGLFSLTLTLFLSSGYGNLVGTEGEKIVPQGKVFYSSWSQIKITGVNIYLGENKKYLNRRVQSKKYKGKSTNAVCHFSHEIKKQAKAQSILLCDTAVYPRWSIFC